MTLFEALQAQHEALLLRQNTEDDILADVQAYVEQVRKEGSKITSPQARTQLRANLRYWAGFVYECTGEYPNTELPPSVPYIAELEPGFRTLSGWWILGLFVVILILVYMFVPLTLFSPPTVTPISTPMVTPTSTSTVTPISPPTVVPTSTPRVTPTSNPTATLPPTATWIPSPTHTLQGTPPPTPILDPGQLQVVKSFLEHEGPVLQIAFSSSGSYLASGSADGTARIWSTDSGSSLKAFSGSGWVQAIAFSPDGDFFASGGNDRFVQLWNMDGLRVATFPEQRAFVFAVGFSSDSKTLAIGSGDGLISLWDWTNGAKLGERQLSNNAVYDLSFRPDGKMLAAANLQGGLFVLDASTTSLTLLCRGFGMPASILSVAYSPVADLLAFGNDAGEVVLVDPLACIIKARLQGHEDNVNAVAFSPDGQLLVSGSRDQSIMVWDVLQETKIVQLRQDSSVETVAFAPRGFLIASGEADGDITLWGILP